MKISIILPARNEEKIIGQTLDTISSYLIKKKYAHEVLVVVNGSNDKTKQIVIDTSSKNNNIKLLQSKPGYGFALKKGFKVAKGDYVVVFNVDFFDLKFIDLVDVNLLGNDMVIGSKQAPWSKDMRPITRRIISTVFNILLKIIFGFKGSDTHGIKIIRKKVVNKVLLACETNSGIFDTEFVIRTQRNSFSIADLPVTIVEKRPARFSRRLLDTPVDIYNLYKALKSE